MPEQQKILEIDLMVPALRFLAESPEGTLTTTQLRERLSALFQPTGVNAERLWSRWDTHFDQTVRNIVSNRRKGDHNMIKRGFATYNGGRISITERGRELLRQIGFAVFAQAKACEP